MKQLKALGISLKDLSSLIENIKSAKNLLRDLFALNAILIFILSLILPLTKTQFLLLVLTVICMMLSAIIIIRRKRNEELEAIKNVINAIRKNEISSPEEINLNENLVGIQEEIKAMFLRTKNDIENLKKLERIRTEFLGNVSHELRTPIFAIQGFIETLLDGAINDAKVNITFLEKANHHTQNLNHLINDLIDISMIESGEMRMSFRYFNVKDFLEPIINECRHEAESKGIDLVIHPFKDKLQLFGDRNKLKQVFINLIQNAIKYTEQGRVEIIIEEEEKTGKIIIRDTGIGISSEDQKRIFERFYRVDKDRSREVGGTGLGLAIVKHIVEAHSSKVEVISETGKGSEFWFRLKK